VSLLVGIHKYKQKHAEIRPINIEKKNEILKIILWITGNGINIMGKNVINTLVLKYIYCN